MAPTVPHPAAHGPPRAPSRPWRPADYRQAIDADMLAYITEVTGWFPPESSGLPIERQRETYCAMCRSLHAGRPPNVRVHDQPIGGPGGTLAMRRYRRADAEGDARVLFFHGGGFVLGDLDSHDDICAEICARTGFEVVSADYRLAPEHPHPAAFDDACAAFEWAATVDDRPVLLSGESAGGNLAAAVAHVARGHATAPIGQVLVCPDLGGDAAMGSYVTHADAPMLGTGDVLFYRQARFGGQEVHVDTTTAPLADPDCSGLPPTVVVTAACDPLSGDGEAYCDRIVAAGGRGWWREEAGLTHSFVRARHLSRRAAEGFEQILAAITALGRGEWPY